MKRSVQRENFSRRLRSAVQEKGLKFSEIATALKVPPSTVGGWTQSRGIPNQETLARLAEMLGCDVDYLAGISPPKDPSFAISRKRMEFEESRLTSPSGLPTDPNPMVTVRGPDGEEMDVPLTEVFPQSCVVALLSKDDWSRMKEAYEFLQAEGFEPSQAKILRAALHACQLNPAFSRIYEAIGKKRTAQDVTPGASVESKTT